MAVTRSRSAMAARSLPGELLEQVLAHVPFQERVRAAAVCRTWRQHLTQRGLLLLWQAVVIDGRDIWWREVSDDLLMFLPIQRWLQRHGNGLLQLQCGTPFNPWEHAEDGLLAHLLTTLAIAAPSLQALRLDYFAGRGLLDSSMVSIASMGSRLRQLALIGVQRVSHDHLAAALEQLPMLQDLAVMYVNERDVDQEEQKEYTYNGICAMRLLFQAAASCPALRTLALGQLPQYAALPSKTPTSLIESDGKPLPELLSRLTALSSLALHSIGWEFAPHGLPSLPQLRRLSLVGDYTDESRAEPEFRHQLSTLEGLHALQVSLPDWPGRLPIGLTQLVILPLDLFPWVADRAASIASRAGDCASFLRFHLPPLQGLRHLAFRGLEEEEVAEPRLRDICAAAAALPHLISLHLVNCSIVTLPDLGGLSRLQLLNLSENRELFRDGGSELASVSLHKMASCRVVDFRCNEVTYWSEEAHHYQRPTPLALDVIAEIAAMPVLEQLALPPIEKQGAEPASPQELAALAQHRAAGMPPIEVVTQLPESDRWSAVDVDLPFDEVNGMLGVQLDRSIVRGDH